MAATYSAAGVASLDERNQLIARAMGLWRTNSRIYRTVRADYDHLAAKAKGMGLPNIPTVPKSEQRQWPMIPFLLRESEYTAKGYLRERANWEIAQIIREVENLSTNQCYVRYCTRLKELYSRVKAFKPIVVEYRWRQSPERPTVHHARRLG